MSRNISSKKDLHYGKEGQQNEQEGEKQQTTIDDFKILAKIGDGAYSQVYKVRRLEDGEFYALKKVKLGKLSDKEKDNAINEVRILASIKHNNVISYKEAFFEQQTQSSIVMEYADNQDLFQKICDKQKENQTFSEPEIWKIFIQIVRGLKALHELNIMHRDLKSANVFLNKDHTVKLGDMNVSKVANQRGLNYTQTGTPYYASPEVWRDEPYDIKSDIWSLGCVLYEVITLRPPFQATDMQGLYKRVIRGQFPRIGKHYSLDLWQMVKSLLQVNPTMRPDTKQIANMNSFQTKVKEYFPEEYDYENNELLKTIRIPKNLMYLSNRLPNANYEKNVFKLNKSITNHRKGNSSVLINEDLRLPNVLNKHKRSQHNIEESQSLPKISSKAKLAAKNDLVHEQMIERVGAAKYQYQQQQPSRQESLSKKISNQSPAYKELMKQQLVIEDHTKSKEKLENKESKTEKEFESYLDNKSVQSKDVQESKQIVINENEKMRKLANVQSEMLGKENSLKRLKEDNVGTGRSRKDLEPIKPSQIAKQKLKEIYSEQKGSLLYQKHDQKQKQLHHNNIKNYIMINEGKINEDLSQPLLISKPLQLQVVNSKKHGQQQRSKLFAKNMSRIAQVYSKSSLGPTPEKKISTKVLGGRDSSLGPYESEIKMSIGNVRLPKVNNKSIVLSNNNSIEETVMEHQHYNAYSKMFKKNKLHVMKQKDYPYVLQPSSLKNDNYIIMGKKATNHGHNNSISIQESESIKLKGIAVKKDMSLVHKKDDSLLN